MYRIELAPGEESVFRTIEELAIGVRNGLVTPRARIFHSASQKWLPIEFHPHYKKALELPASRPDVRAAPAPERTQAPSFAAPPPAAPEVPVAAPAAAAPTFTPPAFTPRTFAPRVVEAPAAAKETITEKPTASPTALPSAVASPVLQLPTISYPDITPVEEPAAERLTSASRSRRPRYLAGAIAVLALGAYATAFPRSGGDADPAPAVADRPALPPLDADTVTSPVSDQVKPDLAEAPAPVGMTQPASSGFAHALEPRAIVSTASAAASPKAAGAAKDSSIAPAPIEVDLAVPTLAGAESLVPTPRQQSDSAMKRILRAVNGGKDVPQRP